MWRHIGLSIQFSLVVLVLSVRSDGRSMLSQPPGGAQVSPQPPDAGKAGKKLADDAAPLAPDSPDARAKVGRANSAPLTVHGLVIDATTKRAIPQFRVVSCVAYNSQLTELTWQPQWITIHRGGRFDLPPNARAWPKMRYRVEAEGYRPSISRVVERSEGDIKLTFLMQADAGISAIVRAPDGTPAAGARATWVTHSREATVQGATITLMDHGKRLGATVVTADAAGRLRLPPECDPGTIVVAHDFGYAEVRPADLIASGVVTLRRWGRVEGRVLAGKKPLPGQTIWVQRGSASNDPPTAYWHHEVTTDADGRFTCDRVVAGKLAVDRVFPTGDGQGAVNGLTMYIDVREGQVTRVLLGGPGRALVGRFEAPKDLNLPIDWTKAHVSLGPRAPHIGFPGDDAAWAIYQTFLNTEEGRAYVRDNVPVGRDGSFRIESVPPGDYQLIVWIEGSAVGKPAEPPNAYAAGGTEIEVKPTVDDREAEAQSVGTIRLHKRER